MRCPFCHQNEDKVVDTRSSADDTQVRRRRECLSCGRRYTTYEQIEEVILSGGDPLVLDDHKLASVCQDLETIPHIKWLRIHTRLPVVLPSRITASLLKWMQHSRFRITMVIHANHANEQDMFDKH